MYWIRSLVQPTKGCQVSDLEICVPSFIQIILKIKVKENINVGSDHKSVENFASISTFSCFLLNSSAFFLFSICIHTISRGSTFFKFSFFITFLRYSLSMFSSLINWNSARKTSSLLRSLCLYHLISASSKHASLVTNFSFPTIHRIRLSSTERNCSVELRSIKCWQIRLEVNWNSSSIRYCSAMSSHWKRFDESICFPKSRLRIDFNERGNWVDR